MTIPDHFNPTDPAERLYDAVRGVDLSEAHRRVLHILSGLDEQTVDDAVSLFHAIEIAYGTRPTPAEARGVREAYDMSLPPEGADPRMAEGLPTYMSLGVSPGPPVMPWWRCTWCRHTRQGHASPEAARADAEAHVAREHGGGR